MAVRPLQTKISLRIQYSLSMVCTVYDEKPCNSQVAPNWMMDKSVLDIFHIMSLKQTDINIKQIQWTYGSMEVVDL